MRREQAKRAKKGHVGRPLRRRKRLLARLVGAKCRTVLSHLLKRAVHIALRLALYWGGGYLVGAYVLKVRDPSMTGLYATLFEAWVQVVGPVLGRLSKR
jgi:hypothetical protein